MGIKDFIENLQTIFESYYNIAMKQHKKGRLIPKVFYFLCGLAVAAAAVGYEISSVSNTHTTFRNGEVECRDAYKTPISEMLEISRTVQAAMKPAEWYSQKKQWSVEVEVVE